MINCLPQGQLRGSHELLVAVVTRYTSRHIIQGSYPTTFLTLKGKYNQMTPQSALGIQGLGSERSNDKVMTDDRELVCSCCPLATANKQSDYERGPLVDISSRQ
jgi:hypothetical protein